MIACPIRYWPIDPKLDNTWVFALNYAAASGQHVVWTMGPLGYLVFPQDIGNNLVHGLIFQTIVWALLIAILADLFFRGGFPLRNLAFFTLCFALSAPLYWFNYTGLENLLLMGVLVLLVRGGIVRYLAALTLIGIIPLIKFSGALFAGGALAGFIVYQTIRLRTKSLALGIIVPFSVFTAACWITLPSWNVLATYIRSSWELSANYSVAMSTAGRPILAIAAAELIVLLILAVLEVSRSCRQLAAFLAALLTIPLFLALKHGFVREDMHILVFFSFACLALALIVLGMPATRKSLLVLAVVVIAFGTVTLPVYNVWKDNAAIDEITGIRNASFAWDALSIDRLRTTLRAHAAGNFEPGERLDPSIRNIIGRSPVAEMSMTYSHAAVDRLNLRLYPVVQTYAAYTPYLDRLNAAWVRDKGPRFLIVDWDAIDDRHPWVEAPATWAEIYRWYNTRASETWSILLERRASPRFDRFELVRRFRTPFRGTLDMPDSAAAIFWTMDCRLNLIGSLSKLLFRVPEIDMTIDPVSGERESFRVIPEVLTSPVMGNFLPKTDDDLVNLLDPASTPTKLVGRIRFGGPGVNSYDATCDASFLRALGSSPSQRPNFTPR